MSEMPRTEFKPCPFCGGTNISERKKYVSCDDCGACGPFSEEEPRLVWNVRAKLST